MVAIGVPGAGDDGASAAGRVLTLLHRRGPLTRAAVTAELGLAASAVGTALGELTALDLVRVGEPRRGSNGAPTGRGRPSPVVEVHPDGPVAVAVQLSADRATVGLVGLDRRIDHVRERALDGSGTDPASLLPELADAISDAALRTERRCVGVCVAMSGFIRESDGFVRSALHLGWNEVPLARRLGGMPPGLPVAVGRAATLAVLAEFRYGAGRGAASMLGLNCERVGVGGGFIDAGAPLTGGGHALEAGHIIVEPGGLRCPCGARGCLEMYADSRALLRAAGPRRHRGHEGVTEVFDDAAAGDRAAREAVRLTAGHLVTGLTSLVNTLAPERVVLMGFLADLYRAAEDSVRDGLTASSVVARAGQVEIVTGDLRHAALVGAAERAFAPLLRRPRSILRADPS
ncbi:ROK family protein [Actinomadura algeriensis]|uniref:NBD/HSP70 family sugar kinase n=1 Tax=Actinomadura algeriensis TaxID=1679523 RepID=A0ABR9K1M7_9ACTN|nr:ROK family protein [Actinomadura algeriensis]MBE1536738.1 putative NBD/HSP70 family sugar kinase [Actinomadura algeriensis]